MIPGYNCLPQKSGIMHSIEKINHAERELLESCGDHINIIKSPCQKENETLGYRCRCAFQMIQLPRDEKACETQFFYAMRQNKKPIILTEQPYFPIAIPQIQYLMNAFLNDVLNKRSILISSTSIINDRFQYNYPHLRRSLSSISFHASWDGKTDIFITLNYSTSFCDDHMKEWRKEAQFVCDDILASSPFMLSGLIGRSKKKKAVVFSKFYLLSNECNHDSLQDESKQSTNIDHDSIPIVVRDTIYINQLLTHSDPSLTSTNFEDNLHTQTYDKTNEFKVQYRKPLDAFHHPNGKVMMKALYWILKKAKEICVPKSHMSLLELYCGCGAHTIPIAKLNAFQKIVAVEMDSRLVKACRENAILNNLKLSSDSITKQYKTNPSHPTCSTLVDVVSGDAADIVKHIIQTKKKNANQNLSRNPNSSPVIIPLKKTEAREKKGRIVNDNQLEHTLEKPQLKDSLSYRKPWYALKFDVLLVDPPRQGLGDTVCDFAVQSNEIQHIIYISCGRKALQRDLNILKEVFDVKECYLMDLFPRTLDAVESLVHLNRRC